MDNFNDYAYYYDLIYKNKNYKEEAKQIQCLLKKYGCEKNDADILNMGCGTGKHDLELCKLGYHMSGVDMSYDMIEIAKKTCELSGENIAFQVADIREYIPQKQYDAVISMFHVMSYQNKNEDVKKAFGTAAKALGKGGIFIFDAWYGPGVLTDKPTVRVKQVEDAENVIYRYANPIMHVEDDVVDVCYDILVINKMTSVTKKISEIHKMRYFFMPEIKLMLEETGFMLKACIDCNSLEKTDFNSWTAYFVAEKR